MTQTTARRNQNNVNEHIDGADVLMVLRHAHCVSYLHQPSLPTINCDWPTLARFSYVRKKGGGIKKIMFPLRLEPSTFRV